MQWLSPLLSARRLVAALKGRAALSAAVLTAAGAVAVMIALVSGPLQLARCSERPRSPST